MPILSVDNIRFIEANNSFEYAYVRVSLDEMATAPVTFYYYLQEGSAEGGSDYDPGRATVTIPAGESFVDVRIAIYGDTRIEGDETFDMVILAGPGATLEGDAAALVSTITIADNDDGVPDAPSGSTGPGAQIDGPTAEDGALPTLTIHDTAVIEGDSSFEYAYFLVKLDRPAPAAVTFDYHLQDVTASQAARDYDAGRGTVTIAAGLQSDYIRVPVYGGTGSEGDETFEIVLTDISNAVFEGSAEAMSATATIIDDDGGAPSQPGGIGETGDTITGPEAVGLSPTVRISDVSVIEGDSSFIYAYLLITLDQAAAAEVRLSYYTQPGTASDTERDYDEAASTFTIPAGTESTYVRVPIYGDTRIEGDETLSLVFTSISNGKFEGDAAAVEATVTILDNDSGPVSGPAGTGVPAVALPAPESTSDIVPVLQVNDVSVIEGNSSFVYAEFLITLDRPAPAAISVDYAFVGGSASETERDFDGGRGTLSIPAGQQSTYVRVAVYGDSRIEGDESFSLVLSGISNANFFGNAPVLVAEATILDNDAGPLSGEAGIGDPGDPVVGPRVSDSGVVLDVVSTSFTEGNSSFEYTYVYVLLSEPATAPVEVEWRTVESGAATSDSDFDGGRGTLTIPAGESSGYVRIAIYGDNAIEGDERFGVEFSSPRGAVFANGEPTITAEVLIADNENPETAATGPDFTYGAAPSSGDDYVLGTDAPDAILGRDGDDQIVGLGGDDTLSGEAGNDILDGMEGNDTLSGGSGNDILSGGSGDDMLSGGPGDDTLRGDAGDDVLDGGAGNDTLFGGEGLDTAVFDFALSDATLSELADGGVQVVSLEGTDTLAGIETLQFSDTTVTVADLFEEAGPIVGTPGDDLLEGTPGDDVIQGLGGDDTLRGDAGNDLLEGGDGTDTINGGDGDDTIEGGDTSEDRRDTIFGGGGDDRIDAGYGNDLVYGQDGNDTIAGGFGADELFGQNGNDVITGSAFSDLVFGGAGDDFVNGGFGFDRINGGTGADRFFHSGADGHASDWIQDYSSAEGDVLLFGDAGADASDFVVRFAHTASVAGERSGDDAVQEAFVNYRGETLWALVDGGGESSINLQIGSEVFDLLA